MGCSPARGDAAIVRGNETPPRERSKASEPRVGVQQRFLRLKWMAHLLLSGTLWIYAPSSIAEMRKDASDSRGSENRRITRAEAA